MIDGKYTDKFAFMCFKQHGVTSALGVEIQKIVDQFTYLGSNISSTENDASIRIANAWIAICRFSFDKIKRDFFQAVFMSTMWMNHLGCNETSREKAEWVLHKDLSIVLKNYSKQHLTKEQK